MYVKNFFDFPHDFQYLLKSSLKTSNEAVNYNSAWKFNIFPRLFIAYTHIHPSISCKCCYSLYHERFHLQDYLQKREGCRSDACQKLFDHTVKFRNIIV